MDISKIITPLDMVELFNQYTPDGAKPLGKTLSNRAQVKLEGSREWVTVGYLSDTYHNQWIWNLNGNTIKDFLSSLDEDSFVDQVLMNPVPFADRMAQFAEARMNSDRNRVDAGKAEQMKAAADARRQQLEQKAAALNLEKESEEKPAKPPKKEKAKPTPTEEDFGV